MTEELRSRVGIALADDNCGLEHIGDVDVDGRIVDAFVSHPHDNSVPIVFAGVADGLDGSTMWRAFVLDHDDVKEVWREVLLTHHMLPSRQRVGIGGPRERDGTTYPARIRYPTGQQRWLAWDGATLTDAMSAPHPAAQ